MLSIPNPTVYGPAASQAYRRRRSPASSPPPSRLGIFPIRARAPPPAEEGTRRLLAVRCSTSPGSRSILRTCKNCKKQFDPSLNHPSACRFHTAHFGGETKRKFESVHTGGTMSTPESGKVLQYWHCCGAEDPFDPGCTAAPHLSYDD